ncbi:uncharacterized protein LOC132982471 [Labrus mixtus]|uniref:uncharacterized protein LOC132982471 n=1 Tax=Labrus mixtus TaxID=508554 RepID=UPI0029C0950F|nr:uncharacterized protein LOC132982471 [Labrus mixtus]
MSFSPSKKMAFLSWMAVTLALLLPVENSLAAVDQNKLANIVEKIIERYQPSYMGQNGKMRYPMFSVAVSIPYNQEIEDYDISKVMDSGNDVQETILNCKVYISSRVVAATVLRWPNVVDQCPNEPVQWPDVLKKCGRRRNLTWLEVKNTCKDEVQDGRADHAEYRILQNFIAFKSQNKDDLLVFYVLASPCDKRCTSESNPWSILQSIKVIQNWSNYAVVFSNVFKPRNGHDTSEVDRREALERLGRSIGLNNIFRCTGQGRMQCTSCSGGNTVARYCFSYELLFTSAQQLGLPQTKFKLCSR